MVLSLQVSQLRVQPLLPAITDSSSLSIILEGNSQLYLHLEVFMISICKCSLLHFKVYLSVDSILASKYISKFTPFPPLSLLSYQLQVQSVPSTRISPSDISSILLVHIVVCLNITFVCTADCFCVLFSWLIDCIYIYRLILIVKM